MKNTNKITEPTLINFNGKEYRLRAVNVKGFGPRLIGGQSLENVLFNADGRYVNDEARLIDENVFFYVEDKYLHIDDQHLASRVERNIA